MTDILIIEDTAEIAETLQDFLRRDGYTCEIAGNGEDGLAWLAQHKVRLVLLDLMLPGVDGFQVCNRIHREMNLPLIILSARIDKSDKLDALQLGADDYIEKPYDIDLLLARVRALYRRHYDETARGGILTEGEFVLDSAGRTVIHRGKQLTLTMKEYELLAFLIENKGKVIRKDILLDAVWGRDSFSEPSTLTVHIKWLRDKIEKDSKNPKHIVTVWGVGYKFEV